MAEKKQYEPHMIEGRMKKVTFHIWESNKDTSENVSRLKECTFHNVILHISHAPIMFVVEQPVAGEQSRFTALTTGLVEMIEYVRE